MSFLRLTASATLLSLLLAGCGRSTRSPESLSGSERLALEETASLRDSCAAAEERRDFAMALGLAARRFDRMAGELPAGDPALIEPLLRVGAEHRSCGNLGLAEQELLEARAMLDARPGAPDSLRAELLNELGLTFKDTWRSAGSRALFEQAWALAGRDPERHPRLAGAICRSLGNLEVRWGTLERALPWYRRSLAIAERSPRATEADRAEAWTWLGFVLLRDGRHAEAGRCFRQALARLPAKHGVDPPRARSALDLLSVVEVVAGHWVEAESLLWRSTRLADAEAALQPRGFGFGSSHPSLRLGLIDVLLHEGRDAEAWEQGQRWAGWVTDVVTARGGGSTPEHRVADAESLRVLEGRLAAAHAIASSPIPGSRRMRWLRRIARIEADRMSAIMAARDPRGTAAVTRPVLPDLQRALDPDEAFVGWMCADWDDDRVRGGRHTAWAYVVRRDGPVHWVRLGAWSRQAECSAWLADLGRCERRLASAAEWPVRVPPDPSLDSLAARLGARLVTPLAPYLTGVKRIVAVYQLLGHWVPLEMLRGADGRELVERYEIAYAPSARTLVRLRSRREPPRTAGSPALVIADPDFRGGTSGGAADTTEVPDWHRVSGSALAATLVRGVLSGRRSVASLPRLPQARAEGRDVAARLPGATLLLGAAASRAAIESLRTDGRLGRCRVMHFATHALADGVYPERSALALAPGTAGPDSPGAERALLRADQIFEGWQLDADLVTLSSCQTATGRFTWSAQDLGLPQAFLAAGARSLLLSPWKVDDLATRALMDNFYARLPGAAGPPGREGTGVGVASPPSHPGERPLPSEGAALRAARLAVRDFRAPDGSHPFAHPAYWAGFVLIGDPLSGSREPSSP